MQKACHVCGKPFEAKRPSAKYCSGKCSKRAQRRPGGVNGLDGGTSLRPAEPEGGPVERKVREDIAAIVSAHPMGEALTEMSVALARALDNGAGAGVSMAAVNRELRDNLMELSRLAVDDSDELADELSAPDLPPQVRDEEAP